ncbi:MAG: protoporphyrinogen oxidase [Chloroflexi bacterium]|nr:protoporphyrinogen oxidase [Chloroflexota bacterium]
MGIAQHIAIVGGGITGLAAAFQAEQLAAESGQPVRCTLVEAADRLGGKVQTERIDGFLLEQGPDSLLARKVEARQLSAAVGLADQIVPSNPEARGTYVVHRGRLEPLPESMMLIAPTRLKPYLTTRLLSPLGKARAGLDLLLPARPGDEDETLTDFVSRRFGREVAERLAVPLLAAVFGGGSGDLSLLATFPDLRRLEQKHRSLLLGLRALERQRGGKQAGPPFVTLRGGLSTLVERVSGALRATDVLCGSEVRRVAPSARHGEPPSYRLELADGREIAADAVVLAAPAGATSRMIAGFAPEAAGILAGITYYPSLVVVVAFPRAQVAHPMRGTGFLVPAEEQRRLIACTWVTRKWPHASDPDKMLMRCYLGGPDIVDLLRREDAELVAMACADLAQLMGVSGPPMLSRVYRWQQGIPRYAPGHLDRVRRARVALQPFPGLALAGAAYNGIGVPDCIRQGQEAVQAVFAPARHAVLTT